MVLRLIIYLFVFWLGSGNVTASRAVQTPPVCSFDERFERGLAVYFENADVLKLFEEAFSVLIEEDTSQNNDDDDSKEDRQSYDQEQVSSLLWFLPSAHLFGLAPSIASVRPLFGKAAPLYLLNRVFRL